MSHSGNFYSALANHQQDANMQSHMRGYDLSSLEQDAANQEELKNLILKTKFENFINKYFEYIQYGDSRSFKRNYGFNLSQLAEYISKINEKLLDDPNFLNNNEMIELGDIGISCVFYDLNQSTLWTRKMSMFYNAGKTELEPNTIRVNLEYINYEEKTIYKSAIDYNSEGSLIIYDAEKYNYDEFKFIEDENSSQKTIDQSNYKEKSIVNIEELGVSVSYIERTNDYIQKIFEAANLKTDKASHRR